MIISYLRELFSKLKQNKISNVNLKETKTNNKSQLFGEVKMNNLDHFIVAKFLAQQRSDYYLNQEMNNYKFLNYLFVLSKIRYVV